MQGTTPPQTVDLHHHPPGNQAKVQPWEDVMMKSRSYFSMRLLVVSATIAGLTAVAAPVGADGSLVRLAESPELEWGHCPEFMPEGCALAVLQGNPAERNADVFFKLPSKATAPDHWHTSAERMVLVSGEMRVHYEGQDPAVL